MPDPFVGLRERVVRVSGEREDAAEAALVLVFGNPRNSCQEVTLGTGAEWTVGRAPQNAIVLEDPSVSYVHARISRRADRYLVDDLGSWNGTWLNGEAVTVPRPLGDGDLVRFGSVEARVRLPARGAPAGAMAQDALVLANGRRLPLVGQQVTIGRAPSNDIVLDDRLISSHHARLQCFPAGWLLSSLEGSEGTSVNGQPVTRPVFLQPGDTIRLGRLIVTFRPAAGGARRASGPRPTPEGAALTRSTNQHVPATRLIQARPGATLVQLRHVVKTYQTGAGPLTVLDDVTLTVRSGEFVAVVGPSGCGKSTLLNMITGIDRPDAGEVVVGGQNIHDLSADALVGWRGRTIGIVFQFFQLLPTLTAAENVMLPMAFCGSYPRGARRARALELLRQVDMEHAADRLPSVLSGGEQQRVAIARALANDPPVLVADEPTGNLDAHTGQQIFELFARLVADGKTVLMVTHDPALAGSVPRCIEMRDGRIVRG